MIRQYNWPGNYISNWIKLLLNEVLCNTYAYIYIYVYVFQTSLRYIDIERKDHWHICMYNSLLKFLIDFVSYFLFLSKRKVRKKFCINFDVIQQEIHVFTINYINEHFQIFFKRLLNICRKLFNTYVTLQWSNVTFFVRTEISRLIIYN